jgi:hypothetical protein
MHGVDAVEQRNAEPSLGRMVLNAGGEIRPCFAAVSGLRVGIAAAQDGAEEVGFNVRWILQKHLVGLGHLADFFI